MIEDEIKKMLAIQKEAEKVVSVYRHPYEDETLRMAQYQQDWQKQFASITGLTAIDQLNLSHVLPQAGDEMGRLREALEPPSTIATMMQQIDADAKRSQRSLLELTEGILSPGVLSGYNSLSEMLHNVGLQAAEMPSWVRMNFAESLL